MVPFNSITKNINPGVSQGAVAAPLLFNIFIFDQLTLPFKLSGRS